jgi:hypothetical protein
MRDKEAKAGRQTDERQMTQRQQRQMEIGERQRQKACSFPAGSQLGVWPLAQLLATGATQCDICYSPPASE